MIIGLAIHTLGAIVWVGGMFFAYVILRPSAGALEPAVRLSLWCRVFSRFFGWVWLSVAALLASGFGMVFLALGGLAAIGLPVANRRHGVHAPRSDSTVAGAPRPAKRVIGCWFAEPPSATESNLLRPCRSSVASCADR